MIIAHPVRSAIRTTVRPFCWTQLAGFFVVAAALSYFYYENPASITDMALNYFLLANYAGCIITLLRIFKR